jgi:ParB family chromosome partitioning protein
LALVENIQRQELNPIEEAQAFKKLVDDFQLTQDAVAQSVGKNRSTIANILRLLKLPEEIQKSIFQGVISEGHARALLSVENLAVQKELFEHTVSKGLSVRELEQLVRTGLKSPTRRKLLKQRDQNVAVLEDELQRTLGTKVRILAKKKRGKIVIEYYSNEDLDRLINIIKRK